MSQYYNALDLNYYSYFCGHDTTPLHGLGPFWKAQYTTAVPVTNTAGSSIGMTTAISTGFYSAAGTYVSVSPQLQGASETGTATTPVSPVPSAAYSFDSQYALRGAYIVLGVLGLCLLLALGVVAYLSHLLHRDHPDTSSMSSSGACSPLWPGARMGGSVVARRGA